MYTLYLKTHNKTGLNYLGYTSRKDPHRYKGSGYYWKRHIKKHGYDVVTTILGVYSSEEELKKWGLHYSEKFDVTENIGFANLKEEAGVGGKYSSESKEKMKIAAKKRIEKYGAPAGAWTSELASELNKLTWKNDETRQKRSESISKALTGVKRAPRSDEFKTHMSKMLTGRSYGKGIKHELIEKTCPYCYKTGKGPNMSRYHFNNCKLFEV